MISVWLCFHDQALSDLSGHNEGTLEFTMILGGGLIFIEFPCETLLIVHYAVLMCHIDKE